MIDWLVEALIGSTLLMLLVLAIRRPVARLWGAHHAYALWALPALRMLLPAIPGWTPLYVPVAQSKPEGDMALALMTPADAARYSEPLPAATLQIGEVGLVPDWSALLLGLWAVGAVVFLAAQWRRHAGFIARALHSSERLTMVGEIDVIVSAHVPGPMAAGIFKRRILLPADFLSRYSPAERRLALLHEGAHHDRRDLAANMAGLLVLATHWWNPIAHVAWRAFRADQELACDATVLAGSDGETRAAYAGAVLKSACVATPVAACAMNHKNQLKERFAMMKDRNFGALRRLAGGLLVAGGATAALAATASGIDQPAPPKPPVPPAVTTVAPPAPPAPPVAAKRVEKIVMIHADDGRKGAKSRGKQGPRQTVIVMNDGAGPDGAALPAIKLFGEPGMAGGPDVQEWRDKDGRRVVMMRRIDGDRIAAVNLAEVRERMSARCAAEGAPVAKDADMGVLATCGGAHMKRVEEALTKAREAQAQSAAALARAKDAIAKADMSEEDRKIVIAALDRAQRQQVMTFELKRN